MAMVSADDSSRSVDSQPKSVGLVWGLAATRRSVCIHLLGELSQWLCHDDSTINIVIVIIIIIINKYAIVWTASLCLKYSIFLIAGVMHFIIKVSDVTIRLYRFPSISIRFFDQQFDLDSIQFRFCYDLHTSVDPTQFVCGRVGTAVLRCWPPTKLSPSTAAVVVGLNREDVEWAKYTDQTVWRCDTELKLPSWTARRYCLMFSLAPYGRCPLSDVRTSPTLVNRPTCLRAYNTPGCR